MELRCTEPNGEIVLAKRLNYVELFFFELLELHLEMNPTRCFFQEDALSAQKIRLSITFAQ